MKICAYVLTYNTGLAPNPFHDVCTIGLCTPNHMHAQLSVGDWLVGVASHQLLSKHGYENKETASRLIYTMEIDEVIDLDTFFKKYPEKRANKAGSQIEQVGDAIYFKNSHGDLVHVTDSDEHNWDDVMDQDRSGNRVFIGHKFWHFGKEAPLLPDMPWAEKLKNRFFGSAMGIRYVYGKGAQDDWNDTDLQEFWNWLPSNNKLIGIPIDLPPVNQTDTSSNIQSVSGKHTEGCG